MTSPFLGIPEPSDKPEKLRCGPCTSGNHDKCDGIFRLLLRSGETHTGACSCAEYDPITGKFHTQ